MKLYKVMNQEENHYGLQYRTGVNRDILPFNPSGSCKAGGIYYADENHICEFLGMGCWVREVTLLPESRVYADPNGNKYKTDVMSMGERVAISKWLPKFITERGGIIPGNLHVYGDAKLGALTSVGGHLYVYGDAKLGASALTSVGGKPYGGGR